MARAASATAPTRAARPYIPFLDAMRVIAIIAVLGIHAIAPAYTADTVDWPTALLRSALGPAVPVFVMMSGALNLTEGAHRRGTAAFLRTRFLRLLPPALAWSALYMLVVQPLLWGTELTGKGLIRQAIRADAAPHLYFLWVVLGLSLLSPVLAPFVERSAGHAYALAAAGVAWTPLTAVAAGLLDQADAPMDLLPGSILTFFLPYVGYYVLGYALVTHPPSRGIGWACAALFPLLVAVCAWEILHPGEAPPLLDSALVMSYFSPLLTAMSVVLFVAAASLGKSWRVGDGVRRILRPLAGASFGVYLVHMVFVAELRTWFPALESEALSPNLVVWALAVVLSFALMLVWIRIPGLRRFV
ncbi:acyltransferase [Helcobacillus massiliensis]|uniref:acyltransferase n=1 Tax=Helcobacillus massiliensis TaxID=521392 RepID=UPI0021A66E09|nr:acyltransferase [Helcobacillus massiliensis]MCT1557961.1 acyltransferase [Helcobacillus massiliensis]MCT2037061.1 acyltransferase [Helcobacillus massiliensis]MCT2332817.1 acyltransferase [Helcobacillus massiliensis]